MGFVVLLLWSKNTSCSHTCSSRVEAMQLGDCGQEMALISTLTEGSRVFLTREESQYFIKEWVH